MNTGLSRWAAAGGMAFAVLMAVGFALQGDPGSTSDLEWRAYFDDRSNRIALFIGMYVKVAGGICLLFFLQHLRSVMTQSEPGGGRAEGVAYAAGMIFLVMYLASASIFGALSATPMRLGEYDANDPEVIRFSFHLGYVLLLVPGMVAASVMAAAAGLVGLRTRVFPAWLSWFGLVAAAVGLLSAWWVPAAAVPLWLAVTSVVMLSRREGHPAKQPLPA